MLKKTALLTCLALAGCAGARMSDSDLGLDQLPERESAGGDAPAFALPGVPLRSETAPAAAQTAARPAAPPETEEPATAPAASPEAEPEPGTAAAPASAPAAKTALAAKPAPAAAPAARSSVSDLDFHVSAAKRYWAKKKYRSAAAEYAAAMPFLPPGDPRELNLAERRAAMLLKAGDKGKAKPLFLAAIARAGELGLEGEDLANAHLGLAYCLELEKDKPGAISHYEKAMALSSSKTTKARIAGTISDLKKAR